MIRRGTEHDLPGILAIVAARPGHFIPAAYELIEEDYRQFPSFVWEENGAIAGFVIWMTNSVELELLWIAVHPVSANNGIGKRLLEAAIAGATTQRVVLLKTASPDSQIPGTAFTGSVFADTIQFFTRSGFREACRIESYWAPNDHCVILYRILGDQNSG